MLYLNKSMHKLAPVKEHKSLAKLLVRKITANTFDSKTAVEN